MRQANPTFKLSAVLMACTAMLSACGGGGGDTGSNSGGRLQLITFPYFGAKVDMVSNTVTLAATATSGLPVAFTSVTPSTCTVSGSQLTVLKAGSDCSVIASQAGGADANGVVYAAADNVSQLFVVQKATQTLAFATPDYVLRSVATEVTLPATTSSSNLPVSVAVTTPAVCSLTGSTLKLLAKGWCGLTATQAGNDNYAAVEMQRFVGVDPLVLADGFDPSGSGIGDTSSVRTKQGGGVKIQSWASSINNGWMSCSSSVQSPNWCYHDISSDGTTLDSRLHYTSYDGWGFGYNKIDIFTPGLTDFASSGDTATGLRVTTEQMLVTNIGVNPGLIKASRPIVVHLDLGPNNGGCHVQLSTLLWPFSVPGYSGVISYGVPLGAFAVTDACGLSGVTATSLDNNVRKLPSYYQDLAGYQAGLAAIADARASAAALLKTSDIARVRFYVMDANNDNSIGGVIATDVTIAGAITLQ
jgi:hypothetical protein